jgi:hypothetical protein
MPNVPAKRRFQFHLLTLLVATLAAGGLLFLSLRMRLGERWGG